MSAAGKIGQIDQVLRGAGNHHQSTRHRLRSLSARLFSRMLHQGGRFVVQPSVERAVHDRFSRFGIVSLHGFRRHTAVVAAGRGNEGIERHRESGEERASQNSANTGLKRRKPGQKTRLPNI